MIPATPSPIQVWISLSWALELGVGVAFQKFVAAGLAFLLGA